MPNCQYCNKEVDPRAYSTYRLVNGWEKPGRTVGGTNALALREPLDKWACSLCIDRLKRGIDPGQETLV